MKRIGILTSGGDAPGMNACIRAAVRVALASGLEIFGIRRGYHGLIQGDVVQLDRRAVANIIQEGGTILQTSRSPEFMTPGGRNKAASVLQQHGIEGLVLIGGDGTFRGGTVLSQEHGTSIVGVPGTIDNDVYGTDYTIGFDTAINCALAAIDRIRDTALSHERLFFVEVMGRQTGFIALASGIAGGAEELVIPEQAQTIAELSQHLVERFNEGKRSSIVVVAEGERPGNSFNIARDIKERAGIDSRVCILGHIQRGGSPTARDRILASKLGTAAVQALINGKGGYMVGETGGELVFTRLQDTWQMKKELNQDLRELAMLLCD